MTRYSFDRPKISLNVCTCEISLAKMCMQFVRLTFMMKSGMLMFQGRIDLCSCFKRFYSVSCRYTSVCIRSRNQLNVVNICFHLICSFLLRFVTTYAMHHWRRKELICPCVFKMFIEQMLRNHSFVNASNLFSLSIRMYFVLSLCCSHLMLLS